MDASKSYKKVIEGYGLACQPDVSNESLLSTLRIGSLPNAFQGGALHNLIRKGPDRVIDQLHRISARVGSELSASDSTTLNKAVAEAADMLRLFQGLLGLQQPRADSC